MTLSDEQVRLALELSEKCAALLAGHAPEIQGACLLELLALFIAGHAPGLRADVLALHFDAVRKLMEVNAKGGRTLRGRRVPRTH